MQQKSKLPLVAPSYWKDVKSPGLILVQMIIFGAIAGFLYYSATSTGDEVTTRQIGIGILVVVCAPLISMFIVLPFEVARNLTARITKVYLGMYNMGQGIARARYTAGELKQYGVTYSWQGQHAPFLLTSFAIAFNFVLYMTLVVLIAFVLATIVNIFL